MDSTGGFSVAFAGHMFDFAEIKGATFYSTNSF